AFGQFLPTRLLKAPKFGAINVHASLLPKYRGGAPVHYALIKGEKETGISIIYMEKKMDAGDILAQRSLTITKQDDVGTLFERLSIMGRDLLIETIPALLKGEVNPIPQDEDKVTFSPNIKREEERIDWYKTAEEIDYQVRGMRPWPGAYTILNGNRIKIADVTPLIDNSYQEEPGTITEIQKDLLVVMCGDRTALLVNSLQPSGKKLMTISAYLNGVGKEVRVGEKFE
ncbi:MAG: methionyl-tRNA formyltransferase, partial [Pisciglobus halotolerans]|nr:methionyl-tRNA formyltransferase [Pisciglobus halotolerans]